jgi:cytochrome P450
MAVVNVPGPRENILQQIRGSFAFIKQPIDFLVNKYQQYGDAFMLQFAHRRVYVLLHPDQVKHVLQDNNKNYPKSEKYDQLKHVLGNGLLTSAGDFWLRQRRIAAPAFYKERLHSFAQAMIECTDQMLLRWEKHRFQQIDILKEMMQLTLEIVSATLFGGQVSNRTAEVIEAFSYLNDEINKRIMRPFNLPMQFPWPTHFKIRRQTQRLDAIILDFIRARRAAIQNTKDNDNSGQDLLSMLMEATDAETGQQMTDTQLRDEALTIFLAGHETTANALAWTFYLLAKNPQVENTLRAAIESQLGDRPPELSDLSQIEYSRQVIEESMRLYPPAWALARKPIADDRIGNYFIKGGENTNIMLCAYLTHRLPEFWEDPETFKPERFAAEAVKKRAKYAFFPFGGGPRLCIGLNFAMMEMQLVLIRILQKYKLHLLPKYQAQIQPLVTLRPLNGIPLLIKKM